MLPWTYLSQYSSHVLRRSHNINILQRMLAGKAKEVGLLRLPRLNRKWRTSLAHPEQFQGRNRWRTYLWSLLKERKRGTSHLIQSIKHHFISKFPNYLIISINRFEYDVIEKRNKKNKSKIIVNPFLKIAEIEYEIYSIIIHTVHLILLRDHHQMLDHNQNYN